MAICDCVEALVGEFLDTTPAVCETVKILCYASSHIWEQVQALYVDGYDGKEEIIMDVLIF